VIPKDFILPFGKGFAPVKLFGAIPFFGKHFFAAI
jgi:hypothetical protein